MVPPKREFKSPTPVGGTPTGATGTVALPRLRIKLQVGVSSGHWIGRRRGTDSLVAMVFIKIITNYR